MWVPCLLFKECLKGRAEREGICVHGGGSDSKWDMQEEAIGAQGEEVEGT